MNVVDSELFKKLGEDMKAAMKSGEKEKLDIIRTLKAGLQKVLIDKGQNFKAEDEMNFLLAESKRRKEAIELYEKGGRQDLADKEKTELALISEFLPKQLNDDELAAIIDEAIRTTGITSAKDMGKLMGALMPKVKGKADGKKVQDMVKSRLAG
ncbi:GatB/YqeY domain-containing protein [bacterium]|nr:GatB/YqeY domain-containing protein [bacterium]NUN46613.1 GatB/YqeY domain-containing protein [bacterium]HMW34044.1 GatB/YqeY domain-containing protein [bacterium]HMW37381.1 GatB/YqeY domain-containing protein [bacterium]HMY35991.1 GatB/YqeY domain-containing protein [bacterium]